MRFVSKSAKTIALICAAMAFATVHASAQDFFSFFGGNDRPAPQERSYPRLPFADDRGYDYSPRTDRAPARQRSSGQAFCVRTCDGRFFPIGSTDGTSRVATCKSQCPSSETKIYYGGTIENAATDNGKSYADLPNAFRYRNEIVSGCTCNGKDQFGLAPIKIEDDPTVRKGDIVAGKDGLMITRRSDDRGATLESTPASRSLRDRYARVPVLASDN